MLIAQTRAWLRALGSRHPVVSPCWATAVPGTRPQRCHTRKETASQSSKFRFSSHQTGLVIATDPGAVCICFGPFFSDSKGSPFWDLLSAILLLKLESTCPQGLQGDMGHQGPEGVRGYPGENGVAGTPGAPGTNGASTFPLILFDRLAKRNGLHPFPPPSL